MNSKIFIYENNNATSPPPHCWSWSVNSVHGESGICTQVTRHIIPLGRSHLTREQGCWLSEMKQDLSAYTNMKYSTRRHVEAQRWHDYKHCWQTRSRCVTDVTCFPIRNPIQVGLFSSTSSETTVWSSRVRGEPEYKKRCIILFLFVILAAICWVLRINNTTMLYTHMYVRTCCCTCCCNNLSDASAACSRN